MLQSHTYLSTGVVTLCQFLPRDATQQRDIAMAKSSVCLSVCPSVTWSHRLEFFKNNFTVIYLQCSLFALPQHDGYSKRNTPKFWPEWGRVSKRRLLAYKSSNISETQRGRTKVTIEVQYAMSIGAQINDLGWPWPYALCFKTRAPWCCYLFIFSFTFSLLLVDKWLPVQVL